MSGPGEARLSGLVNQLAPMIASMVARELRGEQGAEKSGRTSKRRGQLKQAAKDEKEAENPVQRNEFLVSATNNEHNKNLPGI
jgi:hypothetical protein